MSMFKKIKSIFIEEDGSPVSDQKTVETTPIAPPKTEKGAGKSKEPIIKTPNPDAKADEKFIEMLLKAIESNNIDGFDYLEYKQSIQSLTKIEADEVKRFQSAYAMASTMGLNKKTLNDSANRYLQVLATEEKKFSEAFENQRDNQVTQRKKRGKDLEKSIKEKKAAIKQLEEEIKAADAELSNIETEINQALAKVESTKDSFYASYQLVAGQIASDLEKINKFIEG